MKTNLEELDKIINLAPPQLVLISSTNKIEKRFNISLVTDIALRQNIPTALFHNKENVNLEDISYKFTDIRDKILSNYYNINISEISDYRLAESCLTSENTKWKEKEYVFIDDFDLKIKLLSKENQDKLEHGYEKINKSNLYIDDTTKFTLDEIENKCSKLKQENNIKMVVINDLEIINAPKVSIFKKLKELSTDLNIVIIIAYSLRFDDIDLKTPLEKQISDIETIVKNSDIVLCMNELDEESKGIVKLTIAKNNNGNTGVIEVLHLDEWCKFCTLARKEQIYGINVY